jgi:hypothetical protein
VQLELNGYGNAVPPLAEVDTERKANFDQVMKAIEHGISVSRDAMYDRYGLPRPRDEDDIFLDVEMLSKKIASSLELSDSEQPANGKKKALPPKPLIRIM